MSIPSGPINVLWCTDFNTVCVYNCLRTEPEYLHMWSGRIRSHSNQSAFTPCINMGFNIGQKLGLWNNVKEVRLKPKKTPKPSLAKPKVSEVQPVHSSLRDERLLDLYTHQHF